SVEISELLSRMLKIRNIKHQVLNAKYHAKEAEIVAEAGKPSTVTIATNMAGRGTDIKLTPESRKAGGLAIIGTERHESRRVDRQLRGRSGRQGDPGSSQFFVSLEDNLMRLFGSDRIARIMDTMGLKEGEVIQHSMITKSIERAQKKVEENNFGQRKRLLEYDDVMNAQRELIYKRRRNALFGERLQLDILNMMYDFCEDIITKYNTEENYDNFLIKVMGTFGIAVSITKQEFTKLSPQELASKLYNEAYQQYVKRAKVVAEKSMPVFKDIENTRGATVENVGVPFTDGKRQVGVSVDLKKVLKTNGEELIGAMEKYSSLQIIDQAWKEHLREMDDLKQSVQNAVFEQKDPLLIYKFEAFGLFKTFIAKINEEILSFLFKAEIPVNNAEEVRETRQVKQPTPQLKEKKEEVKSVLSGGEPQMPVNRPAEKLAPLKAEKVAGRNDRVSVQYMDGSVKKDVKYKTVEEDLLSNKCVIIDGK
ncbi:MAG: preprotein translocase subunit SecA, partial [Cytophagaceae bacterium]|nr:preprotein translocase subunit SecA [Cytophagaceae bacterium]